MRRTLSVIGLVAWLVAAPVGAQAPPNEFATVVEVHEKCPGLIFRDHEFTDAVFSRLHAKDPRWGRNGKRGNVNDLSHDAGAWRMPSGPGGVAIVDIIAAAGGPDARPAWQDVTQATIAAGTVGAWVAPSGVLPPCLSGAPTAPAPGTGPGQPAPPAPPVIVPDLTEILVELSRIENRITALERALDAHTVDTKERTDVVRVALEQLDAWLRGRRVLRY
jgi:hypothetical protein